MNITREQFNELCRLIQYERKRMMCLVEEWKKEEGVMATDEPRNEWEIITTLNKYLSAIEDLLAQQLTTNLVGELKIRETESLEKILDAYVYAMRNFRGPIRGEKVSCLLDQMIPLIDRYCNETKVFWRDERECRS